MSNDSKYMTYFESLMRRFQNNVLDVYNDGKISKKEMTNILNWTRKIIEVKKQATDNKVALLYIEPDGFKNELV